MKILSKILPLFSYIFHPIFISVYAVLLYFLYGVPYYEYPQLFVVMIQIILMTVLIPMTVYYFLLSFGKVESIMLASKSQRRIPLLIHAILLFILIYKSITYDKYPELHLFFLASLVSTVLALLFVFLGYKASLHLIGITALVLFAILLSLRFQNRMVFIIIVLVLCAGLTASSRLEMKAHSIKELLLGTLIGTLPMLFIAFRFF